MSGLFYFIFGAIVGGGAFNFFLKQNTDSKELSVKQEIENLNKENSKINERNKILEREINVLIEKNKRNIISSKNKDGDKNDLLDEIEKERYKNNKLKLEIEELSNELKEYKELYEKLKK